MTRPVKLGKGHRIKDGKVIAQAVYRDASHAIASKKSKKQKVVKPTKGA